MRVLRPLEESDVDAVLAVYREAWGDARPIHAHELRSWLRNPEVDPESLRVLEIDGRVVGYGDTTIADGVVAVEVAAPDHWETFLIWAEATAREAGASRVRVLSYAGDALAAVAAERGYYLWRSNYTMRIELESDPPYVSPLPAGIEIVRYADHHVDRLLNAINEVFEGDPFSARLTRSQFQENYLNDPGMDPSLWVLAWEDGEIAGFSLGFAEWHGNRDVGQIRQVGVRPASRRRGLGETIVRRSFHALHERGLRSVTLGVDASNETQAVRLYQRVGMRITAQGDNWALDL